MRSPRSTLVGPRLRRLCVALLAVTAAAIFAIPLSQAAAEVVKVNLAGSGHGSVTSSSPAGLECSNLGGGAPGPTCSTDLLDSEDFHATLGAKPDANSYFAGWTLVNGFGEGCTTPPQADPTCQVFLFASPEATATFEPLPGRPGVVTVGSTPSPGSDLVTVEGSVDPAGFRVSDCHFEYGPTTEYGSEAPCVPGAAELGEGSGAEPVEAKLETEELKPATTYHYRLSAANLGGTAVGEDREFTTAPAPPDGCANSSIRDNQVLGAILLPGCMALEMVSPPRKAGQPARSPVVSAEGQRVLFTSGAALAETPGVVSPVGDHYVATRGTGGWATAPTAPGEGTARFAQGDLVSLSFTPDLSSWLQIAATATQNRLGIDQAFKAGLGASRSPLSPSLVPIGDANNLLDHVVENTAFAGASADHSHLYFVPGESEFGGGTFASTSYLPGDPVPSRLSDKNTYAAHLNSNGVPSLELLARDAAGKVWGGSCGSRLGGIGRINPVGFPAPNGLRSQGAISADGSRAYFSTRPGQPAGEPCNEGNALRILERREGKQGPWIGPLFSSECNRPSAEPCSATDGDDLFQGASADGSRVYFTSNRQLASSDRDGAGFPSACVFPLPIPLQGCDLYLYDSTLPQGERLIQVSAGEDNAEHEMGKGARVLNGVTGISGDGSHAYFVAEGVLTEHPNPAGASAVAGMPNLYVWSEASRSTAFIATLGAGDKEGLWGGEGTWRNQAYPVPAVGPDGESGGSGDVLLFESRAELTPNDTDGEHADVFRYDGTGGSPTLECVSCDPGGPDSAAFDVVKHGILGELGELFDASGTDFAEQGRWVSENGGEAVFATAEPLVPGDVNDTTDFYLWRDGRLYRLPGTAYTTPGTPEADGPALSHDGSTVAFQTSSPLLPQDGDTVPDVYVARAGGGYLNPTEPAACVPDGGSGCRGASPSPTTGARSADGTGAGNVKPGPRRCPHGKRKLRRHGATRCVGRHLHRKHDHRRHASTNRRAGK